MQEVTLHAHDYGIPINAEEARTSAVCKNEEGEVRFVIAAKGFLLVINPNTSETVQVNFPDAHVEYPFASFSCTNGYFYTGAGKMFLSLNPFTLEIVHYESIENGEEIIGFSFTEDNMGKIYFTTYPNCHLLRYDPYSKQIQDFGSMDISEKYAGSIAVDTQGWVYIGVGTESKDVIAYHVELQYRETYVPAEQRIRGTGFVYNGLDGMVYGHWEAIDLRVTESAKQWFRFYDGKAIPIGKDNKSPSQYTGFGFQKVHRNGNGGYYVVEYSLAEQYVIFRDRNKNKKRVPISYESSGAQISTIYLGPDKMIYGTSMHPLQLFQFDCSTSMTRVLGAIEKGGGGNVAAYATQGKKIIGAAYAGGKLYELDTSKPIEQNNPLLVSEHEAIHRPRCAVAHQDMEHIIWGGFPAYGMVGGGLGIYHVEDRKNTIIPNEEIVMNQSTVCLGMLKNGNIIGGTSVETLGGAESKAKEAGVYLFNWESKKVEYFHKPIRGTREISQLYIDVYDRVHGITKESLYFVFDSKSKVVTHTFDLTGYGKAVRNGFVFHDKQQLLICLLSHSFIQIDIKADVQLTNIAYLVHEATSGIVLHNGLLYYGSGSHLIGLDLE